MSSGAEQPCETTVIATRSNLLIKSPQIGIRGAKKSNLFARLITPTTALNRCDRSAMGAYRKLLEEARR